MPTDDGVGPGAGTDPVRTYAQKPLALLRLSMDEKLRKNAHKGGWSETPMDYLFARINEELHELRCAVVAGDSSPDIWREAADVACFAMMIADNATRKSLRGQIEEVVLSSKYESPEPTILAVVIATALAAAHIPCALSYRLDDKPSIMVPIFVFDLAKAPHVRGIVVMPLSAGDNATILAEIGEIARAEVVDEIIIPTPLFRIHKALPAEAFGKPVRALYMGGQIG